MPAAEPSGTVRTPATPPQPQATTEYSPRTSPFVPAQAARFHVETGSFPDRDSAISLLTRLRDRGYAVTLIEGPLYRVWVGGYLDRTTANQLAANLEADGFDATLTPR